MKAINVKDSRMYSIVALYDLHTDFFPKAIAGISDVDAHNRLHTKANHVAWLTGSLVQQRFEMAKDFGYDKKSSADELFKNNKGIQDEVQYPSLEIYKKDWETVTPFLREALLNVSAEILDKEIDMGGMKMPLYDLVSFIIYREANCIGQIALWRRLLGYDAMKYM